MIRITHYIDRQFGHPIHIGTEQPAYDVIKFVAPCGSDGFVKETKEMSDRYTAKMRENLEGKTIEEAKKFLKKTFHGTYINIHAFNTPLQNKIEDYE